MDVRYIAYCLNFVTYQYGSDLQNKYGSDFGQDYSVKIGISNCVTLFPTTAGRGLDFLSNVKFFFRCRCSHSCIDASLFKAHVTCDDPVGPKTATRGG